MKAAARAKAPCECFTGFSLRLGRRGLRAYGTAEQKGLRSRILTDLSTYCSSPKPTRSMAQSPDKRDLFHARDTFDTGSGPAYIYRLDRLAHQGFPGVARFPFSIKILLEALLRGCDGYTVTQDDVEKLAQYDAKSPALHWRPTA